MIEGYTSRGLQEALELFVQMLRVHDIKLGKTLEVRAISASARLGAFLQGQCVHMYIKNKRIAEGIAVQTAQLDMHVKCRALEEAH